MGGSSVLEPSSSLSPSPMVASPLHVMPYQAEKRGKTPAEALSRAKDIKDISVINVDNPAAVSGSFYDSLSSSDDESTVDSSSLGEDLTFSFCSLPQKQPIRKPLVSSLSSPYLRSTSSSFNKKSVAFGDVRTRCYNVVMGDHPCCTTGCPLSLGWEHSPASTVSVDDYEATRSPRRTRDDLRTTWDERRSLLCDVSDGEVRSQARKLHRERSCQRKNRTRTCAAFFQAELPAAAATAEDATSTKPQPLSMSSRRASC